MIHKDFQLCGLLYSKDFRIPVPLQSIRMINGVRALSSSFAIVEVFWSELNMECAINWFLYFGIGKCVRCLRIAGHDSMWRLLKILFMLIYYPSELASSSMALTNAPLTDINSKFRGILFPSVTMYHRHLLIGLVLIQVSVSYWYRHCEHNTVCYKYSCKHFHK